MNKTLKIAGFLFASLLFFLSCRTEGEVEQPSPFIEKDTFVEIMYDINILEGGLSNFNIDKKKVKDSAMTFYNGIFEKYNIDSKTFIANQQYYVLTDKYQEVSERVLEKIQAEEEKYKDVEAIKTLSFVQLSQLIEEDGFLPFFNTDTTKTYAQRLDSILGFYRINQYRLEGMPMDSISFEVNINKLKNGVDLFQQKKSLFKKMPTNE